MLQIWQRKACKCDAIFGHLSALSHLRSFSPQGVFVVEPASSLTSFSVVGNLLKMQLMSADCMSASHSAK